MKVKSILMGSIVSLGILGSCATTAFAACTPNTPDVNACAPKHTVVKVVQHKDAWSSKHDVVKVVKTKDAWSSKHDVVKVVKTKDACASKHDVVKVVKPMVKVVQHMAGC